VLCGFDTIWEQQLVLVNENVEVDFRAHPNVRSRARDDLAGFVTFRPGDYSVLTLYDPYPDWTGYDALTFTVYSELAETVTVTLWVADDEDAVGETGSFKRKLEVAPGENRFDLSLSTLKTEARGRELDLARVQKIVVYASRVRQPFSLFLDDFRLI
jgi:hypothetical protein